ncbi:MAG: flavin reductase [Aquamicrobium sp.]|uniref:flavin reductase n=1 Tax=Mesorhizobium sp. Pch-S TaxID=2082387 RepID=UPI001A9313DB|nr:flavin reductase [Mesorhizobium sp. Pch-S]MBR2687781.1 flavin reductase [Aquamicrobium sp.]
MRERLGFARSERAREIKMNMMQHRFGIVDRATFRNGMSRLGTSVNVVSTSSGGKRYGFTASAVCSVSDTPPTLLVCINRASSCFHAFENARYFCVNTLMPGHENLSNAFGGKTAVVNRFALGEWTEGLTGVPVLTDASVSFECELSNAVDEATHRILFGRVVDVRENEEQAALLYCMRRYLKG